MIVGNVVCYENMKPVSRMNKGIVLFLCSAELVSNSLRGSTLNQAGQFLAFILISFYLHPAQLYKIIFLTVYLAGVWKIKINISSVWPGDLKLSNHGIWASHETSRADHTGRAGSH